MSVFLLRCNQFVKKLSQMKGLKPKFLHCFRSSNNRDSEIALKHHGLFGLPLGPVKPPDSDVSPSTWLKRRVSLRKQTAFKNSWLECWRFAGAFWKFGYSTPKLCREWEILVRCWYLQCTFQFQVRIWWICRTLVDVFSTFCIKVKAPSLGVSA